MEAFVTQRWPAAPPVLPQLLGARSPFQACPRRPGRGGWGAGLASGGAQFTCPVSGFVDPLIPQPCFSLLHACLSALAPVHQVQVPVRRLPPLCRFFLPGEGKGQGNASGPLVSPGAAPCPHCWPHRGVPPVPRRSTSPRVPFLAFPAALLSLLGPVGQRKPRWDSKHSHTQRFASKCTLHICFMLKIAILLMSGPVCQGPLGSDLAQRGEFV